ncbi:phage protease [Spongiibacter sp. UBA1325]|uniref:phage protease n=1 Tax=Spongiibacter sp. UBA1325 TaxID=1947543 RepID=UPI00257D52F4|nr:phage protease [Spongiibacter sp. UBA1325]|tara:strand:- start:6015 stop:7100 length:1086 start_codon:yes stop_codon:yes gene_type:complete
MKKTAALKSNAVCVAVCALQVQSGNALQRLIPAGTFTAPRGAMSGNGPWLLTEDAANRLIARAATRSTDIVVDYEHQTLLTEKNGQPAPASGWVDPRSLEWRDDGLYGRIDWKTAAATAISNDEYRYLSPVFPYDAATGEVLDLYHLALTNTPAIDEAVAAMAAARASAHPANEDDTVKREQLIKTLGLAENATDADIESALAALKANADELAALREGLDVDEQGNAVEAVATLKSKAAQTAEPDLSQYVPKSVYKEATQQLAALKASGDTTEVEALIKEGLDDGRIAGQATANWLREQGLAALKAHLQDAPTIAALKGTQTQGKKPNANDDEGELTAAELAVCKNMGLDPETYKKNKAAA